MGKMVQGGKCGSCGRSVGMITREKQIEQDCDKGFGTCASCEEQMLIHEDSIWDAWRKKVRDTLTPTNQVKWDEIDKNIQKAFILQQIEDGTIKIGFAR